ncbi:MAG: serine hydrolase domain-containing protein [Paracoccaceae bacterium]
MIRRIILALALFATPLAADPALDAHAASFDAPASVAVLGPDGLRLGTSGAAPDDPFVIASLGKAAVAVALIRLEARGALDLDDPVSMHVPAWADAAMDGLDDVTVAQLLTMTSGLPDYYDLAYLDAALADPARVQTPRGALGFAPVGDRRAPGRFDYSNTNYVLAQLVVERVTGAPLAEHLARDLFAPLGLTGTEGFGPTSAKPVAGREDGFDRATIAAYYRHPGMGDGALISTARDQAEFWRALLVEQSLLDAAGMARLLPDPAGARYGMGIDLAPLGHSGGDLGYSADVRVAGDRVAVILVARGGADPDAMDLLD